MQMGHMRFEPNINVHITDQHGQVHKTAITEIKNLNSFSVLERATAYEIQRQLHEWETSGSLGRKSTMGWDESAGSTFLQREKEEAHDYRYFPDPDLCPVVVDGAWLSEIKSQIGELPAARKRRYIEKFGLSEKDATTIAADRAGGDFFDAVIQTGVEAKRATALMETLREMSNDRGLPLSQLDVNPPQVAQVARLVADNKIAASKDTARSILLLLAKRPGASAEAAATELGLMQVSDTSAIDAVIDAVLATNPKSLQDFKAGKQAALGGLVGMVLKQGKGLNAKLVQERLKARLA